MTTQDCYILRYESSMPMFMLKERYLNIIQNGFEMDVKGYQFDITHIYTHSCIYTHTNECA